MSLFFVQAEGGIRDYKVTGVQTCALPISTVDLVLNLLCDGEVERLSRRASFDENAPLLRHELVAVAIDSGHVLVPLLARPVLPDERLGSLPLRNPGPGEIGRGAGWGRGEISVVGVSFKKKKVRAMC